MEEEKQPGLCIGCGTPAKLRAHFHMCDKTYSFMDMPLPEDPEDIAHYAGAKQTVLDFAMEAPDKPVEMGDMLEKLKSYSVATSLTWALLNSVGGAFSSFPVPRMLEGKEKPDMDIWKRGIDSFNSVMALTAATGALKEFDDIVKIVVIAANALIQSDTEELKAIGVNLAFRIERFCLENGEGVEYDEED